MDTKKELMSIYKELMQITDDLHDECYEDDLENGLDTCEHLYQQIERLQRLITRI